MVTETTPFKMIILIPLAVLALGTVAAFLVAINHNFDNLAHLWTKSSSASNSPGLPVPVCFAVLFFRTALDSTRSKLEEAAIVGFLAGLSTITAVERIRCEVQDPPVPAVHPLQHNGKTKVSGEKGKISTQGGKDETVGLSRKVVHNLAIPWLLYNLAAGALAWQAIIIPVFLYEGHSVGKNTASHSKRLARTNTTTSENIAVALSIALGLLAPSTLMIVNPASTATILVWLVFPIWISLSQLAVRLLTDRVVPVSSVTDQSANGEIKLGPILTPYALPIIYSAGSHFLLVKNLFTQDDDRSPLTRSAVLLLEIDHLAIFLAFLYWAWARTTMTTGRATSATREIETETPGCDTLVSRNGLRVVLVTLLSTLFLGPGAGVCLAWVVADFYEHQHDSHSPSIRSLRRDMGPCPDGDTTGSQSDRGRGGSSGSSGARKIEKGSVPGTPTTSAGRRARAKSSPKASGHFFGGPLAG